MTKSTGTGIIGNLEKILIGLLLATIIVIYIATGQKELKAGYAFVIVLSLEILLAAYYLYLIRNIYGLFLVGFILLNIGYLLPYSYSSTANVLILTGKFTYFGLGIYLGYKTFKESIKNKDWELFGTLLTLALLFPVIHHFYFTSNQDYLMVYSFALAFLLSTIMYNENLWDKYNASEKKLLMYVLISTIAEVLFISVKLI